MVKRFSRSCAIGSRSRSCCCFMTSAAGRRCWSEGTRSGASSPARTDGCSSAPSRRCGCRSASRCRNRRGGKWLSAASTCRFSSCLTWLPACSGCTTEATGQHSSGGSSHCHSPRSSSTWSCRQRRRGLQRAAPRPTLPAARPTHAACTGAPSVFPTAGCWARCTEASPVPTSSSSGSPLAAGERCICSRPARWLTPGRPA